MQKQAEKAFVLVRAPGEGSYIDAQNFAVAVESGEVKTVTALPGKEMGVCPRAGKRFDPYSVWAPKDAPEVEVTFVTPPTADVTFERNGAWHVAFGGDITFEDAA